MSRFVIVWFGFLLASFSATTSAHNVQLPDGLDDLSLVRIDKGVYVVHGIHALPDKNNQGFISNTGIVLSDAGVVVVDSGGSYQVGRLIVDRVRNLTDQPIVAVFNTHVHGDHWLGNVAIHQAFPDARFYAHQRAIKRLQQGEAEYWQDLFKTMTEGVVGNPELVIPNRALSGGEELVIGDVAFHVHHTGHAHTDNDIMIELPNERLLFTGDVVEYGRAVSSDVPQDFNIQGQIEAIQYAMKLPVETFIPGHGVAGGREVPEASLRFLEILQQGVKRHYDAGLMDYEMRDAVEQELTDFSGWFNMDQLGKLISYVYQQVEAEDFQ